MHWLYLLWSVVHFLCNVLVSSHNTTSSLAGYIAEDETWCPSSVDILPCTCDGPHNFLMLSCDRITQEYSILRATSSIYAPRNFGKFSLTNSRISGLTTNVLASLTFQYIYMRKNTITKIEPEFFDSSRECLKRIEVVHNDVEKFPFKELSSFPLLEHINLKYNSLKSIPDEAFGKILNNRLKTIDLSFNKINHVGSNAFKYLTKLESIDLRYNKLTVINNMAFAGIKQNFKLNLNLANNKLMFIAEGAFENQHFKCLNLTDNNLSKLAEKVFRNILRDMAERRTGIIAVGHNRLKCTCDRVEWIVRLPNLYKLPILDFECSDKGNKPLQDLRIEEIGC